MICSSLNLLFLMPAIFLNGGLLLFQVGTAGRGQVIQTLHSLETNDLDALSVELRLRRYHRPDRHHRT